MVTLGALSPATASAHPEMPAEGTGCYLLISVGSAAITAQAPAAGGELDLDAVLLYGPAAARERRRQIDRDGDLRLSTRELSAVTATPPEAAPGDPFAGPFALWLDEQPVPVQFDVRVNPGTTTDVVAAPLVIRLTARLPITRGVHRLRVEPLREPIHLVETEISIQLDSSWRLEQAFRARGPASPSPTPPRSFNLPPRTSSIEDRAVSFVFSPVDPAGSRMTSPRPPYVDTSRAQRIVVLSLVGAMTVAAIALWILQRTAARVSRSRRLTITRILAALIVGMLLGTLAIVWSALQRH